MLFIKQEYYLDYFKVFSKDKSKTKIGCWRNLNVFEVFYSLHVESRASVAMPLIHFLISGVILAYSSKRSLGFPLFRLATPIATNLNN